MSVGWTSTLWLGKNFSTTVCWRAEARPRPTPAPTSAPRTAVVTTTQHPVAPGERLDHHPGRRDGQPGPCRPRPERGTGGLGHPRPCRDRRAVGRGRRGAVGRGRRRQRAERRRSGADRRRRRVGRGRRPLGRRGRPVGLARRRVGRQRRRAEGPGRRWRMIRCGPGLRPLGSEPGGGAGEVVQAGDAPDGTASGQVSGAYRILRKQPRLADRQGYTRSGREGAPMDTEWMADGKCREVPPAVFFPSDGLGVQEAQRICADCPVSDTCLEYALANRIDHGVWGGRSERERRRILRRRRSVQIPSSPADTDRRPAPGRVASGRSSIAAGAGCIAGLECVVNVSEGRDLEVVDRLAAACGQSLLDVHSDPDHHRTVLTLAGTEQMVENVPACSPPPPCRRSTSVRTPGATRRSGWSTWCLSFRWCWPRRPTVARQPVSTR